MNEKEIVNKQKEIEEENEKNINYTIDLMSLHINGQKTEEYLKFIKKVRSLKKKINKKKTKLAENKMLAEAYLKKKETTVEYFEKMARDYETLAQEKNFFRHASMWENGKYQDVDETFMSLKMLMRGVDIATQKRLYVDQVLDQKEMYLVDQPLNEFTGVEIKAREKIIQKHYDSITAYIMGQVLCYYYSELDFWKECLKQLEKIDDIREFE